MFELLKNLEPPVGFGKNCPAKLAYRKLIRMNMPVADDQTVHFNTTLFALIRESLKIKMAEADQMDKKDEELRETIVKLWPIQAKKMADIVVPKNDVLSFQKMTVGKIYGGMMILENWRQYKACKAAGFKMVRSLSLHFYFAPIIIIIHNLLFSNRLKNKTKNLYLLKLFKIK